MRSTASLPAYSSAGRRRMSYYNWTDIRGFFWLAACNYREHAFRASVDDTVAAVGRRDVLLNLRIVTERTAALGVDGHICEMQLILRSFVELKVL